MEAKIDYTQTGYPVYKVTGLYVTLFDDYLLMEGSNLTSMTRTEIKYKDIISVSYSNGGAVGTSFIEFNTAGRAYRYSPNIEGVSVAGTDNMQIIANAVQARIDNPTPIDTETNKKFFHIFEQ